MAAATCPHCIHTPPSLIRNAINMIRQGFPSIWHYPSLLLFPRNIDHNSQMPYFIAPNIQGMYTMGFDKVSPIFALILIVDVKVAVHVHLIIE